MKKLVMMLAVIAMAAMTQAATVTWSISGVKAPNPDGTFSTTAVNGGIAYLFYGAQNSASLNSAIQGESFTGAGSLYSKATTSTGGIFQTGIGSYANEVVTLYMVIFNGATIATSTHYMISSDLTQTFTTVAKTYNFGTSMPTSWTAIVPEPTSMALLALGVAAVGLRRRFSK